MYVCLHHSRLQHTHTQHNERGKVFMFGVKEKMKMYSYYQSIASGKCVAMNIVETEK